MTYFILVDKGTGFESTTNYPILERELKDELTVAITDVLKVAACSSIEKFEEDCGSDVDDIIKVYKEVTIMENGSNKTLLLTRDYMMKLFQNKQNDDEYKLYLKLKQKFEGA